MRSISPIIATVILLLMTVAAGGLAYLSITSFQSQAQSGGEGAVQQLVSQTQSQLKIESVKAGTMYIRNIGTSDVSKVKIYADGKEIGSCDEIEKGKYCIIQINQTVDCGTDQRCDLTIGAATTPTVIGQLSVDEEELQGEAVSFYLKGSTEWESSNSAEISSYVGDVDGDGWDEIVVAEKIEDGNLTVWNYTSGNLILENRTDFGAYIAHESVYAGDIDNDGAVELILSSTNTSGPEAEIRILNKTDNMLLLENHTSWIGNGGPVYFANTDGDSQAEIISTFTGSSVVGLVYWNKTGDNLMNETQITWARSDAGVSSLHVSDYDGDGVNETFMVVIYPPGICGIPPCPPPSAELYVVNRTAASGYEPEAEYNASSDSAFSIDSRDIDTDGAIEVIFAGAALSEPAIGGIWLYNYTNLTPTFGEASVNWTSTEQASIHDAVAYDVDVDGATEIISGGEMYVSSAMSAELVVWNYVSNIIQLEKSTKWQYDPGGITRVFRVHVSDMDHDGIPEIITIGKADDASTSNVQIRVWRYLPG